MSYPAGFAGDEGAVGPGVEGIAANGGYDAGRWGDYANAVAGKIGAVLFAGCVAGVEGEGKDKQEECGAKSLMMLRSGWVISSRRVAGSGAEEDVLEIIRALGGQRAFSRPGRFLLNLTASSVPSSASVRPG
jgi:hypothetical protein